MAYVKWALIVLAVGFCVAFLHHYLPSHDIVRVVGTEVKRMDVESPGGDTPGAGAVASRDVRFIEAIWPGGAPRVYRNEDTDWNWPPYFKFDSSNLAAEAGDLASTKEAPVWVMVTHYGWRIPVLSMFPNAIQIRKADGPDEAIIPWFNIVALTILGAVTLGLYRRISRFKDRHIDPVLEDVGDAFDGASDYVDAGADRATGLWARLRRWLGGRDRRGR